MKKFISCKYLVILFMLNISLCHVKADSGEVHLRRYKNGMPKDKTIVAASKLHIKIPTYIREWHIWGGAPFGENPHRPRWFHWSNMRKYGKYNPKTSVEDTVPGSAWRRNLNSVGYPLLGPYDSGQQDIIRWQLETARNTGVKALYVHLWASLWDKGQDMTPLPVFEKILDIAAKMKYPVGLHDEIAFRRLKVSKAQLLENSIARAVIMLKRYGKHPGLLKIDGLPVYYFQNWNRWISPENLQIMLTEVEKQVGFVYWIVEGAPDEKYIKIPQIKAYMSHNNSWFLHAPKHGQKPHPWKKLLADMDNAAKITRKYGKSYGVMVYTRFDHSNARGKPGFGRISAEDGMFFVDSLKKSLKYKPDFLFLTQWNDFEECAFIEPAWDFDGFNGDPYRFCRIVGAALGKKFHPAPLPVRKQLDPFIRHKLFGDTRPGDKGPVFQNSSLKGNKLSWKWGKGSGAPTEMRLVQSNLACWQPGVWAYNSNEKLRLSNYSLDASKGFMGRQELRFYAPNLIMKQPQTVWVGIHGYTPPGTDMIVNYRSEMENYRIDSRWERRHVNLCWQGIRQNDHTFVQWFPLYGAKFTGYEGDLLIRLGKGRGKSYLFNIFVWTPDMAGENIKVDWKTNQLTVPETINSTKAFVAVAFDKAGNPGIPRLFFKPQIKKKAETKNEDESIKGDSKAAFFETFENTKRWKNVRGSNASLVRFNQEYSELPYLALGNSMIQAELSRNLIKIFDLSVKMQHTSYCRSGYIALMNENCTQGYGVLWDSSLKKYGKGQGFVSLIKLKFAQKPEWRKWKSITRPVRSGFTVAKMPFAKFKLTWNRKDGKLILMSGKRKLAEATDKEFSKFSKVLISGNSTMNFDNLSVKGE